MKRNLEQLKNYERMGENTGHGEVNRINGLVDLINHIGGLENKVMCEVGCYRGISTETFLNFSPKKLIAIDIWGLNENYRDCDWLPGGRPDFRKIETDFREMVSLYTNIEIQIYRDFNKNIANIIEDQTLDFVYIDGEHTFDAINEDIKNWLPKIKKGGYLAGHDYNQRDVYDAVNIYVSANDVKYFIDSSYAVQII